MARLVQDIPAKFLKKPAKAMYDFKAMVGRLLVDIGNLAGQSPYFTPTTLGVDSGPYIMHENTNADQGDAIAIDLIFAWGDDIE